MLQHWWIVGLAGFLYIVEFAADKIPAVDSIFAENLGQLLFVPNARKIAAVSIAHLLLSALFEAVPLSTSPSASTESASVSNEPTGLLRYEADTLHGLSTKSAQLAVVSGPRLAH